MEFRGVGECRADSAQYYIFVADVAADLQLVDVERWLLRDKVNETGVHFLPEHRIVLQFPVCALKTVVDAFRDFGLSRALLSDDCPQNFVSTDPETGRFFRVRAFDALLVHTNHIRDKLVTEKPVDAQRAHVKQDLIPAGQGQWSVWISGTKPPARNAVRVFCPIVPILRRRVSMQDRMRHKLDHGPAERALDSLERTKESIGIVVYARKPILNLEWDLRRDRRKLDDELQPVLRGHGQLGRNGSLEPRAVGLSQQKSDNTNIFA